jgi:predicted CXXCH cytochrome family protein
MRLSARFLLIIATSQPVWAGRAPGSGLAGSPHDFTRMAGTTALSGKPSSTCFFCHFQDSVDPQDANVLAGNAYRTASTLARGAFASNSGTTPLWNPELAVNFKSYVMYQDGPGAPTRGKKASQAIANGMRPGSTSLLCLSCHDGSIAINAYGNSSELSEYSGRVTAGGLSFIGSGSFLGNHHPIGFDYDAVQAVDREIRFAGMATLGSAGTVRDHLSGAGATRMECGTCHSVHNTGNTGEQLLWRSDRNSRLCLTCHDKGFNPGAATP